MSAHAAIPTAISNVLVRTQDSASVDAFGRWRVSNKHILLSGQLTYADNPLVWDTELTWGGTYVHNTRSAFGTLTVTGTNGSKVIRQTKRYWLYRAGQSHEIVLTFAKGVQVANIRQRVGYFDASDGVFLEIVQADFAFVFRSFVTGVAVDTRAAQSTWNLDKLDGSGGAGNPSGVTLTIGNAQQLHIDMQWRCVGRVRVGFDIGGVLVYVHEFNFTNVIVDVPYMRTGTLPVRYEIESIGASAGATLEQLCAAVVREGGDEEEGFPTGLRSSIITPLTATTTPRSALSVRLRDSHVRAFAKPLGMSLLNLGADRIVGDLVLNPTFDGGSLSWSDIGQGLQKSVTQLRHISGSGHQMGSVVAESTNQNKDDEAVTMDSVLGVAADIAGTSDILSIIVEGNTVANRDLVLILRMLELF